MAGNSWPSWSQSVPVGSAAGVLQEFRPGQASCKVALCQPKLCPAEQETHLFLSRCLLPGSPMQAKLASCRCRESEGETETLCLHWLSPALLSAPGGCPPGSPYLAAQLCQGHPRVSAHCTLCALTWLGQTHQACTKCQASMSSITAVPTLLQRG